MRGCLSRAGTEGGTVLLTYTHAHAGRHEVPLASDVETNFLKRYNERRHRGSGTNSAPL